MPLKDGSLRERWGTHSAPTDRGENDDEERKHESLKKWKCILQLCFISGGASDPLSHGAGKLIMRSTD